MSLISRMKKQTCVHWARTGTNAYGRAVWGEPEELVCRWADKAEKFVNANNEELVSNAIVYVDGVAVGDVLLLGTLDDSGLNLTEPFKNGGAWEVKRNDATPNLKNTETLYKAYL